MTRDQIEAKVLSDAKRCEWMLRNAARAVRFGRRQDEADARFYAKGYSEAAFVGALALRGRS